MAGGALGASLYRWMEAHRPELTGRVVFTTSQPVAQLPEEFLRSGSALLRKPFPLEKLSEILQAMLAAPVPTTLKA